MGKGIFYQASRKVAGWGGGLNREGACFKSEVSDKSLIDLFKMSPRAQRTDTYLLLTGFEVRTVSYGPSFSR